MNIIALDRAGALRRYHDLRLQAFDLLAQAGRIASQSRLPDLLIQQARAAGGLAGIALHEVPASPSPEDARKVIDDLFAVARVVDPFVEEIGRTARVTLDIDYEPEHWERRLHAALDGNATQALADAADELAEADDDNPPEAA